MRSLIYSALILYGAAVASEEVKPSIAVLLPAGGEKRYIDVYQGLKRELGDTYSIDTLSFKVEKNKLIDDPDAFAGRISALKPKAIVLMENNSIPIAKAFQKRDTTVPLFSSMMLQVSSAVKDLKNVAGVKFEVPAFTQFSNLKYISESKFSTVGVFYRKSFAQTIQLASENLAKDNVKLDAVCVDCSGEDDKQMLGRMNEGWSRWEKQNDVALWVLADNVILMKGLKDFWIPKVGSAKIPVVTPEEIFVNGKPPIGGLGLLAINPDYVELGAQLSQMITDVVENEETTADKGFEELISVFSVLNKHKATSIGWKLNAENMGRLQKLYE